MLLAVVLDDIGRRLTGRLVLQLQVKFVIGSRAAMCASPTMQVSYNICNILCTCHRGPVYSPQPRDKVHKLDIFGVRH